MKFSEKLGTFYLGRHHDLASEKTLDDELLYDSRDLTTHAICVGMTGSGKTGLCVSLLEEATLDGIPVLAIDPKGDLGNLALTFPELGEEDFRPWVNPDDALRNDLTVEAYAAQQAELWRNGLASWGQDGDRIRRFRESADLAIYTPGSDAGIPVSILASFRAPPDVVRADGDLMRERVSSTVTGILALMGIDADPIQSRDHILLSTIMDHLWRQGVDLDLPGLIAAIQSPPVERIGVLELDSFYAAKDRFALAMRLNNLLAAPSFQSWMSGVPLNIQDLLYTPAGKPRIAIFSIAHLAEPERMFFVSLLLNQVLGWMRSKPGTNSLRALLYMDEIFGYIPPTAEPPSKRPFLTLLKQARAYGVGLVLATQNPVDLDYKGLSNTGTWFLGRLQTERDKLRVLEGLEGVAAGGGPFDRQALERTLAGLGKRVFLMHNVHEDQPIVFHTRWAMSYLRGPLTRQQIRQLMQGRDEKTPAMPADPSAVPAVPAESARAKRPVLPPSVPQVFLPVRGVLGEQELRYEPRIVGLGRVRFVDRKTKKVKHTEEVALLARLGGSLSDVDWEAAEPSDLCPEELEAEPEGVATFGSLAAAATKAASYRGWKKALSGSLYKNRRLELFRSPGLGMVSEPEENERDFRVRLTDAGREKRDGLSEALRKKYARRVTRLEERIRRAAAAVDREKGQASSQKMQTVISLGATLLAAFVGRKKLSTGTLGRATTTIRGAGRSAKEKGDVKRAEENVTALQAQLAELNTELENELDILEDRIDPLTEELETTSLQPRRSDVEVRTVALAWAPFRRAPDESLTALWT